MNGHSHKGFSKTVHWFHRTKKYKRRRLLSSGVVLLHENVRSLIAALMQHSFRPFEWKILSNTLYLGLSEDTVMKSI